MSETEKIRTDSRSVTMERRRTTNTHTQTHKQTNRQKKFGTLTKMRLSPPPRHGAFSWPVSAYLQAVLLPVSAALSPVAASCIFHPERFQRLSAFIRLSSRNWCWRAAAAARKRKRWSQNSRRASARPSVYSTNISHTHTHTQLLRLC